MLHQQLLQQQLASQANNSIFNDLPPHIISTLDNMAFGIAQKENIDSFEIKQKLVDNINNLSPENVNYLLEQMSILIDKSVHNGETITDDNVEKKFITFLIKLYY